jgi:hypothetical protein
MFGVNTSGQQIPAALKITRLGCKSANAKGVYAKIFLNKNILPKPSYRDCALTWPSSMNPRSGKRKITSSLFPQSSPFLVLIK